MLILNKKIPLKDSNGIIHGTLGMADPVHNLQLFNLTKKIQQITGQTIKIRNVSSTPQGEQNPQQLTNTEAECLFYLLQGKPSKTIGAILGKAQKTVEFHINNIKAKWNCHTKSDIFAMAYELGYLNILPASLYNNMLGAALST